MSELFSPNFWQIKTFGDALAPPASTPLISLLTIV